MAVYVDDMYKVQIGRFRGMNMSHMIADTSAELMGMADRIGVKRRWIQKAGTPREHFDISMNKRKLAVEAGAQEVTMREMAKMIRDRRLDAREDPKHNQITSTAKPWRPRSSPSFARRLPCCRFCRARLRAAGEVIEMLLARPR